MPGGDGTGPIGRGPMTGRAAGLCAEHPTPGYTTPGYGQGFGRGRGRGIRRGFLHTPGTEEVKVYLENLVKNLKDELKAVTERLKDLSNEKKES